MARVKQRPQTARKTTAVCPPSLIQRLETKRKSSQNENKSASSAEKSGHGQPLKRFYTDCPRPRKSSKAKGSGQSGRKATGRPSAEDGPRLGTKRTDQASLHFGKSEGIKDRQIFCSKRRHFNGWFVKWPQISKVICDSNLQP